jgi:hypothetical protein
MATVTYTPKVITSDPKALNRYLTNELQKISQAVSTLQQQIKNIGGGGDSLFTSSVAGDVPASGGGTTNFLRADGSWVPPAGSTDALFTSATPGDVPASGGGTTAFLRADGTWAIPPSGGSDTDDGLLNQLTPGSSALPFVGINPVANMYPGSNTFPTDSGLVVQAAPSGNDTNRRFLITFGLEADGTAGSGSGEGNVTLYSGAYAAAGAGFMWAFNPCITFASGYTGGGGYCTEFDLNNNTGVDLPAGSQFVGIQVNSGGTNKPQTAMNAGSTSTTNAWNVGYQATNTIAGFAFLDSASGAVHSFYSSGPHTDGLNLAGTYSYGIDGSSGTFSSDFIRGPGAFSVSGAGNVIGVTQSISGLPTTTQLPTAGTWGVFKDTSGGGVYLAANDGGTIKKVALT